MSRFVIASLLGVACLSAQAPKSTFNTARISVGCNPVRVIAGDFNGDHKPDLVFQCSATSASLFTLLLGKGDGTFGAPIAASSLQAIGTGTGNRLSAGDFNRDGKTDLAYAAADGTIIVLLSMGDGTFHSVVTTPKNTKLSLAAVADLDGDGFADVVFISNLNDSLITYAYGKGDGTFGDPIVVPWPQAALDPNGVPPNPHITNVVTADFNKDGKPDITVAVVRSIMPASNGPVRTEDRTISMFTGPSGFAAPTLKTYFGATGMLAGDFDGDGKLDLAMWGGDSFIDSADLYFFPNFLTATVGGYIDTTVAASDRNLVQAGDVNGEGQDRFLVASSAFNAVVIFTDQGVVKNQNSGFVDLGTSPNDIAVVDLNGDDKPDFVTSNTSSATIALNTSPVTPHLTTVLNGASFATAQPLAPGSLGSLFGLAIVTAPAAATTVPLPMTLGGLTLTVGGIPAPLLYVSATQVNFQVPWNVQAGPVDVIATVNGTALTKLATTIAPIDPGVFSLQYGVGQGIATNLDGTLVAPAGSIPGLVTRPAKTGDTIIVYATGLGAVSPSIGTGAAPGDILRNTSVKAQVLIGGKSADVPFSGLSPQFVGVNQLNVVVPSGAAGVVPLQINSGGVLSTNQVTIAVQ